VTNYLCIIDLVPSAVQFYDTPRGQCPFSRAWIDEKMAVPSGYSGYRYRGMRAQFFVKKMRVHRIQYNIRWTLSSAEINFKV
jgi:hypothetical protein